MGKIFFEGEKPLMETPLNPKNNSWGIPFPMPLSEIRKYLPEQLTQFLFFVENYYQFPQRLIPPDTGARNDQTQTLSFTAAEMAALQAFLQNPNNIIPETGFYLGYLHPSVGIEAILDSNSPKVLEAYLRRSRKNAMPVLIEQTLISALNLNGLVKSRPFVTKHTFLKKREDLFFLDIQKANERHLEHCYRRKKSLGLACLPKNNKENIPTLYAITPIGVIHLGIQH
ncbi:hypothetical protein GYA19_04045 [Candidatus Beckwithbacteria bacterium]|nr:hypothetical protein [Candidatus Beckwithbacteria bacterium]